MDRRSCVNTFNVKIMKIARKCRPLWSFERCSCVDNFQLAFEIWRQCMIANTFKCFKTTVRVLVFFVAFSMLSYKGSSGIFVAISDTTRILLVFKQDKFTELLSHFVFSCHFGYCFAKMI